MFGEAGTGRLWSPALGCLAAVAAPSKAGTHTGAHGRTVGGDDLLAQAPAGEAGDTTLRHEVVRYSFMTTPCGVNEIATLPACEMCATARYVSYAKQRRTCCANSSHPGALKAIGRT